MRCFLSLLPLFFTVISILTSRLIVHGRVGGRVCTPALAANKFAAVSAEIVLDRSQSAVGADSHFRLSSISIYFLNCEELFERNYFRSSQKLFWKKILRRVVEEGAKSRPLRFLHNARVPFAGGWLDPYIALPWCPVAICLVGLLAECDMGDGTAPHRSAQPEQGEGCLSGAPSAPSSLLERNFFSLFSNRKTFSDLGRAGERCFVRSLVNLWRGLGFPEFPRIGSPRSLR